MCIKYKIYLWTFRLVGDFIRQFHKTAQILSETDNVFKEKGSHIYLLGLIDYFSCCLWLTIFYVYKLERYVCMYLRITVFCKMWIRLIKDSSAYVQYMYLVVFKFYLNQTL